MNAKSCYEKAWKLVEKELGSYDCKCPRCKGTGKMGYKMLVVGSKEPPKSYTMTCIDCEGSGNVDERKFKQVLMNKHVWCRCECEDTIYAKDGIKVFGNDTYLCAGCGMVAQFG